MAFLRNAQVSKIIDRTIPRWEKKGKILEKKQNALQKLTTS